MSNSRQSVVVKHITDRDVEHHIKVRGARPRPKTRTSCHSLMVEFCDDARLVSKKKYASEVNKTPQDSEVRRKKSSCSVEPISDSTLLSIDNEMGMSDLFCFKTPKRSKRMTQFALESAIKMKNANTEKENEPSTSLSKTPKKVNFVEKNNSRTPSRTPKRSQNNSTPRRTSQRLQSTQKYGVQEVMAHQRQDDEDESDESVDSESDEDTDFVPLVTKSSKSVDLPSATELYFEAHKAGRIGASTSDRTLSRLKTPQLNFAEMQSILNEIDLAKANSVKKFKGQKSIPEDVKTEMARLELISKYRTYFKKWMLSMTHGFNIILYGFGSKRKLVQEFCEEMLPDFDTVYVNGYFPGLFMKSILSSICDVMEEPSIAQQNQLNAICSRYSTTEGPELFLIVHNIDGVNLRTRKAQDVFCQLSQCKRIHIVATIDHVNAPLIWDQNMLIKFKWLWYDVTTYERYDHETSYENSFSLMTSGSGIGGSLALSGLLHVSRSLTPNARGIFKLIAEFQIEDVKSNQSYIGISFSELYQTCREKFLVNSELTLRTQLTEFLDHKLIQIKKGIDGAEHLMIPLDSATLKEYLDQSEQ